MLSSRIHLVLGLAGLLLLAVNPVTGVQPLGLAVQLLVDAAGSFMEVDAVRPEPIEVEPDGLASAFVNEPGSGW